MRRNETVGSLFGGGGSNTLTDNKALDNKPNNTFQRDNLSQP